MPRDARNLAVPTFGLATGSATVNAAAFGELLDLATTLHTGEWSLFSIEQLFLGRAFFAFSFGFLVCFGFLERFKLSNFPSPSWVWPELWASVRGPELNPDRLG